MSHSTKDAGAAWRRARHTAATKEYPVARILVVVAAMLSLLGGSTAVAGTADDPEVVDDCGVGTIDEDGPLTPWTDVCAAWLETGDGTVTAVVQLATDVTERPNPSIYWMTWTTDDGCTHGVALGDRMLSDHVPDPPNVHRGGNEGYRTFASHCPQGGARAYVYLDESAVVEDGTTISLTVDLGALEGPDAAVATQYTEGRTLRGLTARTAVDCELCLIYSDETRPGRDHVVGG
jgi:hypothetical protein